MRKNNFMNKIIKLKGSILAGIIQIDPSISGYLYTFSKIEGGRMHFHRIPYV